MKNLKLFGIGLSAAMFIAGFVVSTTIKADEEIPLSGYLGDYSKLKPIKGEGDEEIRRWVTSKDVKGKYPKMIVESVVFHPEPQATKQVSVETLKGLRTYTDMALARELAKSYSLVSQAGPGVARVRLAITGVAIEDTKLKPREYIPVSAIFAGIAKATGERDKEAFLMLEGIVTDSVSDEKIGMAVRKIPGKKLLENDSQLLTVDMMKSVIDDKAMNARKIFDGVLK